MWLAVLCSVVFVAAPFWAISYSAGRSGVDLSGPRQNEVQYSAPYIRLDETANAVARVGAAATGRLSGSTADFQQFETAERLGSVAVWEVSDD
jgi:hypothetical protein